MNLILLFGGKGSRMQNELPKQFIKVNDKTIMQITLEKFAPFKDEFDEIVVVTDFKYLTLTKEIISNVDIDVKIVDAGLERENSIANAFEAIKNKNFVLVHDGARCNIDDKIITQCIKMAKLNKTFTVAIPTVDTLCLTKDKKTTNQTICRDVVYAVQTPQGFLQEEYEMLFAMRKKENTTDLVDLYGQFDKNVNLILGSKLNFKVTTPEDLQILKALI